MRSHDAMDDQIHQLLRTGGETVRRDSYGGAEGKSEADFQAVA